MNVQSAVEPNALGLDAHFRRLRETIGQQVFDECADLHAIEGRNFGLRGGKAVVIDYASPAMRKILGEHADTIHNHLDLVSPP